MTRYLKLYNLLLLSMTTIVTAGSALMAQSTSIAINANVLQPSVKRFGVNLGTLNNYDSGQTLKNLVTSNPGFEGQVWNSTIRCVSGTVNSCTDEDQYSGWPANYWLGATYEIFYGASAGRTGNVVSSTASGNGQGITLNFGDSGVAPVEGDYLIVRKYTPGSASFGWNTYLGGNGSIGANTVDLPAGSQGSQTLQLTAPTAADVASISYAFDNLPGKTFLQLSGNYQLQFQAKGLTGSDQLLVQINRSGGASYLQQYVPLTTTWKTYTFNVSAAENGTAIGPVQIQFGTVYATNAYLDEVSFSELNTDPTNPTVFRDPVVNALKTMQPGIIRDWSGQLGDTLNNLLTPLVDRKPSGFSPFANAQMNYGLHDFLVLCQTVGAEPWFIVPSTFSDVDTTNLIQYLAGNSTTTYGAKRIALGQTTPWTQVFSKIHLEFGNEEWNSGFKGGSIEYAEPDGSRAQHVFALMRAQSLYSAAAFDLILGGQAANPGLSNGIQSNANNNDTFAFAPYLMSTVNSYSNNELLFGPTFAEPEAFASSSATTSTEGSSPGEVYQDSQSILTSTNPVPLDFYEINMGTINGAITQGALNSYTPSLGAGLAVVDAMLVGLKQFDVVNQAVFALPQYSFTLPNGFTDLLWGIVVDMGVTDLRRPQYLALEMANQALSSGAQMLQTVHSGADPTWNQALVNGVQFTGAHDLQSYAFANGNSRSLIVFNFSRTSALPVTFGDVNQPTGTVQMQQMTSVNPTDTNESSNVVQITPSTLSNFNSATGLTLPPYSMTVLTWSHVPSTPPQISNVAASAITGSAATITWTTDQASSSVLNYGTTASYGSKAGTLISPPALNTSHSVSVSGLTPSTIYDYTVTSVNSNGDSSTSTNYSFTTAPQAPVISQIVVTPAGTSATIAWTTDLPSSSLVNYGVTTTYGSSSPLNSTLVTIHSVTITGLSAATAYNFDVVSANAEASVNAAGNTASSTNMTFTTLAQVPVISAVQTTPTSTSVTITWTTDQLSTTLVNYGTTTNYGTSSTLNQTLSTSHSVVITGLTPSTTYDYQLVSTNSGQNTATSANLTFATVAPPNITYLGSFGATTSGVNISWSTDQLATTQLAYGTTTTPTQLTTLVPTLAFSHGVALSNLSPATTYYYIAQSTNASGATGFSAVMSFTTQAVVVVTAGPVISSVLSNPTATSVTITWSTDQPATGFLSYGTTTSYGNSNYNSNLSTSQSVTLNNLTPGATYDYQIIAANSAGTQTTSQNYTFATIQPPSISAVSSSVNGTTGATVTWTTDQASSSLVNYGTSLSYGTASVLSATLVTSHSVTLTGLTAGTIYNFDVVSANAAGATSTSSNYTVTTPAAAGSGPAPSIGYLGSWSVTSTGGNVSWSTNVLATTQIAYGTTTSLGQTTTLDPTLAFNHGATFTGLLSGTTYYYQAQSTSATGVTGYSSILSFTTQGSPPVTTGPVISNVIANPSTTSATVTWTTDQAATGSLNYGVTTGYGSTANNSALSTSQSITLNNLTPGTTYDYQIISANSSGTQTTSTNYTFTTTSTTGAQPPVISSVASAVSGTGVTITWTTDQASSSLVNYGTTASYGSASTLSTALVTSHSVALSGLTAGTTYYFDVVSANAAQLTTTSSSYKFSIAAASSGPAPYVGYVGSWSVTSSQANVSWSTDVLATTQLAYGTTTALGQLTPLNASMVFSHGILLTGLQSGTTYYYVAQSTGADGVTGYSSVLSFTTQGTPPVSAGPVISNVAATVTSTSATITWTTDQAATGLLNYGVTTAYGSSANNPALSTSQSITLSNLTPGTTYDYQIISANSSGTQTTSTNYTFTTTSSTGAQPPVISSVASAVSGTGVTITWTTDQASSSLVNYGVTTSYGSASTLNSSLVTSHSVTLSGLTAGTTYDFDVVSANSAGMQSKSGNYTFSIAAASSGPAPYVGYVGSWSITSSQANVSWSTDVLATTQLAYGTTTALGQLTPLNTSMVFSHGILLTGLQSGTTYYYVAQSTGANGVTGYSSVLSFTTQGTPPSSVGPVISNVAAVATNTSVTISWTTDQAASAFLNLGTTTSYGSAKSNSTLATSQSITYTNLTSGTSYDYQITAANAAGTQTISQNYTFTTTSTASQPPVISSVTSTVSGTSATISWTTDQASSSLVNFGTSTGYGSTSPASSTQVTSHSVTLTGLTAGTTYNFDVFSTNSQGLSGTSANYTFAVPAAVAGPAPYVGYVGSWSVTASQANVSWSTDVTATTQLAYGTTTALGQLTPLDSTMVVSHGVLLTGLQSGTTYYYVAQSTGADGVTGYSTVMSFTTH